MAITILNHHPIHSVRVRVITFDFTQPLPSRENAGDKGALSRVSKPGLSVSINVDSTSDPDKLEKQLKLLRDYGVI